jgi:hypothetical protein
MERMSSCSKKFILNVENYLGMIYKFKRIKNRNKLFNETKFVIYILLFLKTYLFWVFIV